MRAITNTNWNCESPLVDVNELDEDTYTDTSHYVSFDYDGRELIAIVDFTLTINTYTEEENDYKEVIVTNVDLSLLDIYEDGAEFQCTTKEDIAIQNELQIDLKIQF
jgi:hypothetical protein